MKNSVLFPEHRLKQAGSGDTGFYLIFSVLALLTALNVFLQTISDNISPLLLCILINAFLQYLFLEIINRLYGDKIGLAFFRPGGIMAGKAVSGKYLRISRVGGGPAMLPVNCENHLLFEFTPVQN